MAAVPEISGGLVFVTVSSSGFFGTGIAVRLAQLPARWQDIASKNPRVLKHPP